MAAQITLGPFYSSGVFSREFAQHTKYAPENQRNQPPFGTKSGPFFIV
jgi:hypothetical protein